MSIQATLRYLLIGKQLVHVITAKPGKAAEAVLRKIAGLSPTQRYRCAFPEKFEQVGDLLICKGWIVVAQEVGHPPLSLMLVIGECSVSDALVLEDTPLYQYRNSYSLRFSASGTIPIGEFDPDLLGKRTEHIARSIVTELVIRGSKGDPALRVVGARKPNRRKKGQDNRRRSHSACIP